MYQTIDIPADHDAYITVAYDVIDGEVVFYTELDSQDRADVLEAIYETDPIFNG